MATPSDRDSPDSKRPGKSIEQIAEEYGRSIRKTRAKILQDFHDAYVAQMSENEVLDLQSICLVEQRVLNGLESVTRYWFEYKPVI